MGLSILEANPHLFSVLLPKKLYTIHPKKCKVKGYTTVHFCCAFSFAESSCHAEQHPACVTSVIKTPVLDCYQEKRLGKKQVTGQGILILPL